MVRLSLPADVVDAIERHLEEAAPSEDGAFLTVAHAEVIDGERLVGRRLLLPKATDWEVRGKDQLRPSATYLSRAISAALEDDAGLVFLHSHPDPAYPAGLSSLDRATLATLAATIEPLIRAPFGAIAIHPEGWAGEVIVNGTPHDLERIAALDRWLRVLDVPVVEHDARDSRQTPMLGPAQPWLRALHVGVIGCGGIGSPLAETLARMGVARLTLVDDDVLDDPSGIRRVFGATMVHLDSEPPPRKVDIVGDHVEQLGLGVEVARHFGDVRERSIAAALLDCDVVLCVTDTHGSRAFLNDFSLAYGIPLIDAGVQAGVDRDGWLASMALEVRLVTWTTPCLWCRGTLSGARIREENLPPDERSRLAQEGYVSGAAGRPEPSAAGLTVAMAGIVASSLLGLLSPRSVGVPSGYVLDVIDPLIRPERITKPDDRCRCGRIRGRAGRAPIAYRVIDGWKRRRGASEA